MVRNVWRMTLNEENKSMKVFIGYDTREDIAYQVCKHSILRRQPSAEVKPLKQKDLRETGWYTRPVDKLASTEFTFTRFLVPELSNFEGWALFIDCDIILTVDIKELFDQADDKYAVMCVKHDYTPNTELKMDGIQQTVYPRKNWSSVMLINCGHPSNQALTRDLVNNLEISGAYLHRFSWLTDDKIGELDHTWNYLVGVYNDITIPKLIHYTEGGPWFEQPKYRYCEFHQVWKDELIDMMK
jgi:lipopolysaccharide biosynthesis glycosyltransferase